MAYQQQNGYHNPNDVVPGEQYRYALTNFRIAHEKVESQRGQLEEQEKQIAELRARIATLEGSEGQGMSTTQRTVHANAGGSSVDDFSIKTTASKLERFINRWAADVVRMPPCPLSKLAKAALTDLEGPPFSGVESDATPVLVQNLLRHALSEAISEGIINVLIVTNSTEANIQLTRIHEHIFGRDPTVAGVWRRQTFSASVEQTSVELSSHILSEHMDRVTRLLSPSDGTPNAVIMGILDQAYAFSRMLHASKTTSGGTQDAFYKGFVPDLSNTLNPGQVELVKRCVRSEAREECRVGACVFPGLVKMTRPTAGPPVVGPDGVVELNQTVVRRAQVICECALGITGQSSQMNGSMIGRMMTASPLSMNAPPLPPHQSMAPPPQNQGYMAPPPQHMSYGPQAGSPPQQHAVPGYQPQMVDPRQSMMSQNSSRQSMANGY